MECDTDIINRIDPNNDVTLTRSTVNSRLRIDGENAFPVDLGQLGGDQFRLRVQRILVENYFSHLIIEKSQ